MKIFILTLYLFSGAQIVESVIQVTGYVGGSAVIRCPYDGGYEGYSKYLCRGSCPRVGSKDIPIRTEGGQTKAVRGRFYLHDDIIARVFTVTITGLTAEDSGLYWCGVKTGFGKSDFYIEVALKVLKAQVVTKRPEVITTTEVTEEPSTATKAPSTISTFSATSGITSTPQNCEVNSPIESQQATVSFNVLVSCIAAGIAALMILSVVLGCYAAKRKKGLEPAELPLSIRSGGYAPTCSERGTTREVCSVSWRNVREIDPVYEGLNLKHGSPEAEDGRPGTRVCGEGPPLAGASGWSCLGKGTEREREPFSMKDTFSKGAENEYNTLGCTSMGAENEYDTLRCTKKGAEDEYDTLGCTRKGAENEYDTPRCTRMGAENEYDTLRCTSKGAEDEYDTLGCTRKGAEDEYDTLGCTGKGAGNEYEAGKGPENREYERMTKGSK